MTTVYELKEALRETLDNSGVTEKIKAQVRAEVFKALDTAEGIQAPELSHENLIVNELIREYLLYNRYQQTESIFIPGAIPCI
uniref:LisH domain-containing protein FOPNL n=1 Tax=Tetraselmis sp. GSL018 TaxID=582737 RepID=A0A061RCJ3_9CHLO|mmetsp:Transcript_19793/g.47235  ORF Transcript_19793/g.47235 Transcript_19793/m.47235 type:complete len:83 (-) Transcript_19793:2459-2707(-)|eukprot:CAMPEP_0177587666 /NCGR_PEP_ID=MMETSP0419_2-20121207/5784_1 /TAXON_ID=582737 /ORGANISM="Tetraselmis sp., Strain GSL018" /LENGTH=82 /DNA_ID=CAMNT_0019077753 /DNA_START=109 /DNA_END=357 /DNA_ORIENTATION=+